MKRAKSNKPEQFRQLNFFGEPLEPFVPPKQDVVAFEFEGSSVRMVQINGEPWWVAGDVCRALGYGHAPHAVRMLKDKHKGVHSTDTLGGNQSLTVISEAGLYDLIMKSKRPEAVAFKDWVVEEVLPAIRKRGFYSSRPNDRLAKIQAKMRCDLGTAKARLTGIEQTKKTHRKIADIGGKPANFRSRWNNIYDEISGRSAAELKVLLELKSYETPLDHMSEIVLSEISHANALSDKLAEFQGVTDPEDRTELAVLCLRRVKENDLAQFGQPGEFALGVLEHPVRGKLIDVVRRQIESN